MNLLQHALIEKAGHDHGFEHVLPSLAEGWVLLGSARHPAEVSIQAQDGCFRAVLTRCQAGLPEELARGFPEFIEGKATPGPSFLLPSQAALARWLRRAAALAQALPNQAMALFAGQVQAALAELGPAAAMSTEVQRMVRQRVGQQAFREAMLDYWGGACAVTGVALPQALRASHAKAWALCTTDAERLDVYNGFLLSANLDSLFDTGLATFDDEGVLHLAPIVATPTLTALGLAQGLRLRWIDQHHLPYLALHRAQCGWWPSRD